MESASQEKWGPNLGVAAGRTTLLPLRDLVPRLMNSHEEEDPFLLSCLFFLTLEVGDFLPGKHGRGGDFEYNYSQKLVVSRGLNLGTKINIETDRNHRVQ